MPYIKQVERPEINEHIDKLNISHPGALNYAITRLIHNYLKESDLRYSIINAVIGVLECAKLELYRQIPAKYEDGKRRQNGSVSDLDALTLEDVR